MPKTTLSVAPFRGARFRFAPSSLTASLCPPYDVISPELARRLRRGKKCAVHLELPVGGPKTRYGNAKKILRRWLADGTLVQDESPCFYLVEQSFSFGGRSYRRTGFLAALGLDDGTASKVLKHERTLSKHKEDRSALLREVKANTSPIFGVYSDPAGTVGAVLSKAKKRSPEASGKDSAGVRYRVWRITDSRQTGAISQGLAARGLLIADGHHRYEVARAYWQETKEKGADRILAYLAAEQDAGLIVHPTHRVLPDAAALRAAAEKLCRIKDVSSAAALEKALAAAPSPYAFGLANSSFALAVPAKDSAVPTGFSTEWISKRLLDGVDAHDIVYCHGVPAALKAARELGGIALIMRPFSVADIRRAVERGGVLPQKSTYFYPKIATGIAFRLFG